jgi:hypothetical protein
MATSPLPVLIPDATFGAGLVLGLGGSISLASENLATLPFFILLPSNCMWVLGK